VLDVLPVLSAAGGSGSGSGSAVGKLKTETTQQPATT
jgi:hypothetical protein